MADNLLENNLMLVLNPFILLGGVIVTSIAAFIAAYAYSNTHDIKKSIILYIPISVIIAIVITILGSPVIISMGIIGFGLVVLIYASNHFFYK